MLRGFDPKGPRDLVFVPVGVNYDRVLEDRTLLLDRSPAQGKASSADTLSETLRFVRRNARLVIANEWHRFGYACVSFGSPLSTREWLARKGLDLASAPRDARFAAVEDLAHDLMARIARVIPVLPVSLVASVLVDAPERAWSELELKSEVLARWRSLEAGGAYVHVPRGDQDYAVSVGLRMLTLRHLVTAEGGLLRPVAGGAAAPPLLRERHQRRPEGVTPRVPTSPASKRRRSMAGNRRACAALTSGVKRRVATCVETSQRSSPAVSQPRASKRARSTGRPKLRRLFSPSRLK